MRQVPRMKNTWAARGLVAMVLGYVLLVPIASAESDAVVRETGGMRYVSGGVGEESLDRINSLASDFNIKLVFALSTGEYLSDVKIAIADRTGKTLLDTTSEGPWFLATLPAGTYQVVATFAGKEVKRQIAIGPEKLKTIHFRWNAE